MRPDNEIALRTIKNLRKELRVWGNFYVKYEMGNSYPSRSACDRLSEPVIRGGNSVAPEIDTPSHILVTDRLVNRLSNNCRKAIRVQYLCSGEFAAFFDSKKSFLFWLKRAEIALMGD